MAQHFSDTSWDITDQFVPVDGHISVAATLDNSWPARITDIIEALHQATVSTGNDFMRVGDRLQVFQQQAEQISGISSNIAEQIHGEHVQHAITGLSLILDGMSDFLNSSRNQTERHAAELHEIMRLLDRVAEPLSGFRKINKMLRMLGISTKIESSRLQQGATGFHTLANDVETLSVKILENSTTILNHRDLLFARLHETLNHVLSLGSEQYSKVHDILKQTGTNLSSLVEVQNQCAQTAELIASMSAEVTRSISAVVMSMQFHDIVRQQIEHVDEALRELSMPLQHLLPPDRVITETELMEQTAAEVVANCELQAAQLQHAESELDSASTNIIDSLRAIASQESRMANMALGMNGTSVESGTSVFDDLQSGLRLVSSTLEECAETGKNLATALEAVAGTVSEVGHFVQSIETIGSEIELIAINAQIQAARTGNEGAALGVLAEAIQKLSVDAIQQTNLVTETLLKITQVTSQLNQINGDHIDVAGSNELAPLLGNLQELLYSVNQVQLSTSSLTADLTTSVQELTEDIESAAGEIDVSTACTEIQHSANNLQLLASEIRTALPGCCQYSNSPRISELMGRYTMHSERKIHTKVAGSHGILAAEAALPEADHTQILDDNVELF